MELWAEIAGMTPAELRNLYDSAQFERRYGYRGWLGARRTPQETEWRLWTPAASEVALLLYSVGSPAEAPAGGGFLGAYPMTPGEQGVWSVRVPGDCKGVYYTYRVTVAGTASEVTDPYARACGVDNVRSMVADLAATDPEGWQRDSYCYSGRADQAVVWETHVRDFSGLPSGGFAHPGKFLAFAEEDTHVPGREDLPTGLAYLKKLGITHVQLLPVFDFATVSEETPGEQYNWGYDPVGYNVPDGAYATDPYHGDARIREFKQMVLALHRAGIGLVMDVVYNHSYASYDSVFQKIIPYYYHRTREGEEPFANGSGCGCELASERVMVRRFILDSVLYWASEYHVDGFRFDLMGLTDVETVNEIRRGLNRIGGAKNILMYGEPWYAEYPSMRPGAVPADQASAALWEPGIGYFSDRGRDALRGSSFRREDPGFIAGAPGKAGGVLAMAAGGGDPLRLVQYVSCHDNYTLWDKISATVATDGSGFDSPELIRLAANKLAAAAVLLSGGMPFLMGGEEFGRTKYADGNSYRSPLSVNGLDWARTDSFRELVEYYRGLIAIRRRFFALGIPDEIRPLAESDGLVAWSARVGLFETAVILNATDAPGEVRVPAGRWQILANESVASAEPLFVAESDVLWVHARGVLIAEKEAVF